MHNDGDLLQRLDEALAKQFANRRLKVADLALAAGISERQLQRKLSALAGKTPAQYIFDYRMNRARDYLRLGLQIGDIAHAAGFSSHAHFAHRFKSVFGLTPSSFRRQFLHRRAAK